MIAAVLLSALFGAPTQSAPSPPAAPHDDATATSALEGWAFLVQLFERFDDDPYGLVTSGEIGALPRAWIGPALEDPRELPARPVGAQGFRVHRLALTSGERDGVTGLDVELDLRLRAHDPVAGTLLLEHVLAHLEAQPEVLDLERPTTEPLPDGGGLLAEGLRLRLDLARRPAQRGRSDEVFASRELALRTFAGREGSRVPDLRFSPHNGDGSDNSDGAKLRQADGAQASADDLHALLARLEDARRDVVVAALELRRVDPESNAGRVEEWSWVADLGSVKPPRVADPGQQSGLAAMQVLFEVLQGLRDETVELSGFVPDSLYGDPLFGEPLYGDGETRGLDLRDADVEFLNRTDGLGLEVRRLTVACEPAHPNMRDEQILVMVDLAFHGPDPSAATRLYELLALALVAQPEFRWMTDPALTTRGGDAAVVEVAALRLTLVVEPRPLEPIASNLSSELSAMSTITRIAADRHVRIGMIDITPSDRQLGPDRIERLYRVRPSAKSDKFSTQQIYNFTWFLEQNAPELTLTSLSVKPAKEEGFWTFELGVTELRTKD